MRMDRLTTKSHEALRAAVDLAAKNGNPTGRLNKVVFADGTVLHDTQLGGDEGNKAGYDPNADPKKK